MTNFHLASSISANFSRFKKINNALVFVWFFVLLGIWIRARWQLSKFLSFAPSENAESGVAEVSCLGFPVGKLRAWIVDYAKPFARSFNQKENRSKRLFEVTLKRDVIALDFQVSRDVKKCNRTGTPFQIAVNSSHKNKKCLGWGEKVLLPRDSATQQDPTNYA